MDSQLPILAWRKEELHCMLPVEAFVLFYY